MEPLDSLYHWGERLRDPARARSFIRFLGKRFLADPLVLESNILYSTTDGDLIEVDPQSGSTRLIYQRRS